MSVRTARRLLRAQRASRVQRLRAQRTADDQALLTLRIDRNLEWRDIAQVLADAPMCDGEQLACAAAALRKRFERVTAALRRMAAEDDRGESLRGTGGGAKLEIYCNTRSLAPTTSIKPNAARIVT